jgi:hypothetical protein
MKVWLIAATFALAFLAAGVFFATRDSFSDADQAASVGSFLLALATLGSTAVVAARSRMAERTGDRREEETRGWTGKPKANPARSSTAGHPGGSGPESGTNRPVPHYGSRISIGSIQDVEHMHVGDGTTTHVYNDYSTGEGRKDE